MRIALGASPKKKKLMQDITRKQSASSYHEAGQPTTTLTTAPGAELPAIAPGKRSTDTGRPEENSDCAVKPQARAPISNRNSSKQAGAKSVSIGQAQAKRDSPKRNDAKQHKGPGASSVLAASASSEMLPSVDTDLLADMQKNLREVQVSNKILLGEKLKAERKMREMEQKLQESDFQITKINDDSREKMAQMRADMQMTIEKTIREALATHMQGRSLVNIGCLSATFCSIWTTTATCGRST
jgi:hypothetical protein